MIGGKILTSCKTMKPNFDLLQQMPPDALYKIRHLKGNVGIFTEKGGTIAWYADQKHASIVDTQFPDQVNHLLEQLFKITDRKIESVYNTHHHGDHTGGNVVLKDMTPRIISHVNSKSNQERAAKLKGDTNHLALPNIVFDNEFKEVVGEESMACQYFGRAHTDGDIVVHFQNTNIAHIGDLVFNRRFPYIDMGAGAGIKSWISVLDQVIKYYDSKTIFVCGHSSDGYDVVLTKDDITAFQSYLSNLLLFGEKAIAAGKTLEEVKANTKLIPGSEQWKGDGIARSLDAVYQELNPKF